MGADRSGAAYICHQRSFSGSWGEDLGDPFLQFKVLTAQGEAYPGTGMIDLFIFRKVLSTDQPNLDERVFEVDMTLSEAR